MEDTERKELLEYFRDNIRNPPKQWLAGYQYSILKKEHPNLHREAEKSLE